MEPLGSSDDCGGRVRARGQRPESISGQNRARLKLTFGCHVTSHQRRTITVSDCYSKHTKHTTRSYTMKYTMGLLFKGVFHRGVFISTCLPP